MLLFREFCWVTDWKPLYEGVVEQDCVCVCVCVWHLMWQLQFDVHLQHMGSLPLLQMNMGEMIPHSSPECYHLWESTPFPRLLLATKLMD